MELLVRHFWTDGLNTKTLLGCNLIFKVVDGNIRTKQCLKNLIYSLMSSDLKYFYISRVLSYLKK